MGYNYERERPAVFTEDGQVMFLRIRDRMKQAFKDTGAITVAKLIDAIVEAGETGELSHGDVLYRLKSWNEGAWAEATEDLV